MKHHLILITLLWCTALGCKTNGQDIQHTSKDGTPYMEHLANLGDRVAENYTFICYDSNYLHYDTASTSMRHFFDKWLRVVSSGKGHLNIVHIGGSHVQGGTMPHRIRCNILQSYPDRIGERGFLFPYSAAAKCNNPHDYRVHCKESVNLTRCVYKEPQRTLGVGGIAITAHDSLTTLQLILNEPRFDFATQKVVPLGQWNLSDSLVSPPYAHPDGPTISLYGDSIEMLIPADSIWSYTLRGFLFQGCQEGITYHSIGVNGAAVPDYIKCPLFTRELSLLNPDVVVFGIGINDAAGPNFDTAVFHQNYLQLIDSIKSVNPRCAFIFITNNDSYRRVKRHYSVNENAVLAREVFYQLAKETGGAVWDQFEVMGGLKSMDLWYKAKLAQKDRVHFTRAGYELVGDLFSEALLKAFSAYITTNETSKNRITTDPVHPTHPTSLPIKIPEY